MNSENEDRRERTVGQGTGASVGDAHVDRIAPTAPASTASVMSAALDLAAKGVYVAPACWPNADGNCGCGRGHTGRDVGKAPLTPHGVIDATTDPQVIKRWWSRWPTANVFIDLARSGLVDIAPDSTEALGDFTRRGIPPGAATFTSGGGNGHRHFLMARPEGCPTHRVCRREEFDLLANGYAIAPPSRHRTGRLYAWTLPLHEIGFLPDAPEWVVAMLRQAAERTPGPSDENINDMPPVRLSAEATRWWNGEQAHQIEGGEVDRSRTLWEIGRALARAGATEPTIAAALAERDVALGYLKYATRRDGGATDYRAIAAKVMRPVRERDEIDEEAWADLGVPPQPPGDEGTPEKEPFHPAPAPLPDSHYVPRYVRYAESRTDAPPAYHEALALVQLSAAVGPAVRIPLASKPSGMQANVWLLLLGDSTLSRKSTSQDLSVDIMRAVDAGWFLATDQSPQGFVQEIAERDGRAAVWHRDEFRSFLAQLKAATCMTGGRELLMKLYDGAPYHRRLRTKKVKGVDVPDEARVDRPYLVAITAGVGSRIIDVLSVDDVVDGFIPRFLIVAPKERPPRRPASSITPQIEAERSALIETLRAIHTGFDERGECSVQFAPGVWDRWNAYAAQIEEQVAASTTPDVFGPIAGRMADYALKIAALLQAAEGAPGRGSNVHITLSMLESAITLCERLRKDAEDLAMEIGSSISERRLQRFVELARRSPGISRREAARALRLDKREMDNLEATALDREVVSCGTTHTGGRPRKAYWSCD